MEGVSHNFEVLVEVQLQWQFKAGKIGRAGFERELDREHESVVHHELRRRYPVCTTLHDLWGGGTIPAFTCISMSKGTAVTA